LLATCLAGSEGIGTMGVEGFYYIFGALGCSGIGTLLVIGLCGIDGFGFV